MKKKTIFLLQKYLLIVTDQHFPNVWKVIRPFCELLDSLQASDYHLILLGDLFRTWFSLPKTFSKEQTKLVAVLTKFRKNGGQISFLIGNRDIFFSESNPFLPFDYCSFSSLIFQTNSGARILFTHGNLINRQDKNYFLWRKIIHSFAMKCFISLLSTNYLTKLTQSAEQKIKTTNQEHKQRFCKEEWRYFLTQNSNCNLCVVGHFHPPKMLVEKIGSTTGIILEAWEDKPAYLIIKHNLQVIPKVWQKA